MLAVEGMYAQKAEDMRCVSEEWQSLDTMKGGGTDGKTMDMPGGYFMWAECGQR